MYQYKGMEDTIAAVSTASGPGGIGMVRLSGSDSLRILQEIFLNSKGLPVRDWRSFSARYGTIVRPNGVAVDEVLVTVMRKPKSYTCEDVVEISCHGGQTAVRAILELCLQRGARLAHPGEFTKRAFLNGRIDLTQAEAVLDVIHARTEVALQASERQLKGELNAAIEGLREKIMTVFTRTEAVLNFPDDTTGSSPIASLKGDLVGIVEKLGTLLGTSRAGRILKDGLRVVICGKPNVGKSSLLNALLRFPRAIVTDVAGTTRDVIEEGANILGVPVNLIDTAGILEPRDKIEKEAVRRSQESIETADVVLLVLDHARPLEAVDFEMLLQLRRRPLIVVVNKTDLPCGLDGKMLSEVTEGNTVLRVSAQTREGFSALEEAVVTLALGGRALVGEELLLNNIRHIEALTRALHILEGSLRDLESGTPLVMISEEIKSAVNELDAVTGRNIDADLLEQIFSRFCIGK
jgi:tRNA modification GTPase